ncbi:flavonoid 3'-monooxygenase [Canna indica]|uniref:Flavonoid 3'-monooxygenase n=1 Tax=Canna indica TaxID=4628 RepID=A0AAQ3Q0F5_9LILI|nr:flavonoid 3'-monooxygenase [Canna indica]
MIFDDLQLKAILNRNTLWTTKRSISHAQHWAVLGGVTTTNVGMQELEKLTAKALFKAPKSQELILDIVLIYLSTTILSSLFLLYFSKSKFGGAPLSPGPRGWPILDNLPQLGTKPHHTLYTLSKVYGHLFRLRFGSVDVVVAASASVASQFLRANDANFCDRPPNSGAEHVAYNYRDLMFTPYGSRWRALRKLCQVHLFSAKALDEHRWVCEGEVGVLVRALGAAASSGVPINLGQAVNVCVTNALARATTGRWMFEEVGGGEEARVFKEMIIAEHRRVEGNSGKTGDGRDLLSTLIGLKGEPDVDGEGWASSRIQTSRPC